MGKPEDLALRGHTTGQLPRALLAASLLLLISSWANAQLLVVEPDQPRPVPSPPINEPQSMLVSPAAEPDPALSIRFWLAPDQRLPGNAMVQVQRALLMHAQNPDRAEHQRNQVGTWSDWLTRDLSDLPRDEVRSYLASYQNVLDELYELPYFERTEYDLRFQDLTGVKIFTIMIPELQQARELARLLQLDIRLALAEERHDDALRSIQAGIRLGEVAGTATPIIIGRLVGIAIHGIMLEQVRTAIATPDAPNYYWALATLPESFWDMRAAIEFELNAMPRLLTSVRTLPDEALEPSAWRERLLSSIREFNQIMEMDSPWRGEPQNDHDAKEVSARLLGGVITIAVDGLAREYLDRLGKDTSSMTPSETILRATRHDLLRERDLQLKWLFLPESLDHTPIPEMNLSYDPFEYRERDPIPFPTARTLTRLLTPAMNAAQSAGVRSQQTVAVLATAEALRMHAARHGRFPEILEQLEPVPAWRDPVSNQPFVYELRSPSEVILKRSPMRSFGWTPPDLILKLREE